MRCHICNTTLGEKEVQINRDHGDFDPCGTCLEVIGDVFSHDDESIIDEQLEFAILYTQCQDAIDMEPETS